MGLNPPIPQKDSDWEIRVAVLLSLLLQMLLIFVGPMRKRSSHPVPRFAVWSCYLLADWVADLALGLLLNNMGNIGGNAGASGSSSISHASSLKKGGGGASTTNNNSPIIFAFWTPFLLLHLGGPDTITAYSLEDNELWLRHLIGLLFELFSALVIFSCSVKTNPMIPATVLIFVVGIIKYGERTYSLYSGSVDGFRESILGDPDPGPNYAKLMTEFDAKEKAGLAVQIVIADGEAKKAHDALEQDERSRLVKTSTKSLEAQAYDFYLDFRRLFVNLILSYKERKISQAYFLEDPKMTPTKAFEVIEVELNFIYDMVYTKTPVAYTTFRRCPIGCVLRFVGSGCLVSALIIFFLLDKDGNGILRKDVGITYALLLGGLALDAIALAMLLSSNRMLVWLERTPWLARLAQVVRFLRLAQVVRFLRLAQVVRFLRQRLVQVVRFLRLAQVVRFLRQRLVQVVRFLRLAQVVRFLRLAQVVRFLRRRWSERTSQMNLISYCLGKPDRKDDEGGGSSSSCCFAKARVTRALAKVCRFANARVTRALAKVCPRFAKARVIRALAKVEIFHDFFFIRRERLSCRKQQGCQGEESLLLNFIFEGLRDVAKKAKDKGYQKMKETCDYRGEGVLVHDEKLREEIELKLTEATRGDQRDLDQTELTKKTKEKIDILVGSIKRDFDESLLLWHIATDLCLLPLPEFLPAKKDTVEKMKPIGKTLSEYMLYLLIKQPEMLSATAGIGLLRYRDTCAEAQRFFRSADAWDPDHADARRMLLSVNTSKKPSEVKGDRSKSVLFDACILAKVLRELGGDFMWEVVAGVWREMLTYAASKCRGSTHVRQLSRGGELITLVWFLMSHMGIGDMYQIQDGDATAKLIVHDQ